MKPRFTLAALVLVVAGCSASPAATPSSSPTDPSQSPPLVASPTPTAEPTSAPPSSPANTPQPSPGAMRDLGSFLGVRVAVDGLAVRRGPGTSYEMLAAYRWVTPSNTEELATDELRVDSGHYLFIEHGPLTVNGIPWFQVANVQQPDETSDDMLRWDADGDEFRGDYGWVAGESANGDPFLVAEEIPPVPGPVPGPGPEPYALLAGTGSATTDEFAVMGRVLIRWYAIDPEEADCTIELTVEPTGEVIASFSVDGLTNGEGAFPAEPSSDEAYEGDMAISVETDCTWSLHVVPEAG